MGINYIRKLLKILVISLLAIFYTHQKIMILKSNYAIEKDKKKLLALIDQNQDLLYNLTKRENPKILEEKFYSSNPNFKRGNVVKVVKIIYYKEKIKRKPEYNRNLSYAASQ
jgi:hypothetical protein